MKLRHAIVADDNHAIRQSLRAFLVAKFLQIRIDEAQNGHQVLDLVAKDPPNLVLMDVDMPQLDGLDTTRAIKADWPEIRVIILALHAHHHALALQAGADACIFKGNPVDELLQAIGLVGFEILASHERTRNLSE